MISTVSKISKRAKAIRKNGEPWTSAIKRASRELKASGTLGRKKISRKPGTGLKTVPKKKKAAKKAAKKRRVTIHQTGGSDKLRDQAIKAKPPGKRKTKSGKPYYEYRKNRTDMPGKLTGSGGSAYNEMILSRIRSNTFLKAESETKIIKLQELIRTAGKNKALRTSAKKEIARYRAHIKALNQDTRMLKRLIS